MTFEKTIAVIGGGFAGVFAAQSLEKQVDSSYRVLLIEKKSHFYNPIAGARAAVQDIPVLIPYTRLFKQSRNKVIHATAERLEEHTIQLSAPFEGSTELHFDYLVLATGTAYPAPSRVDGIDLSSCEAELNGLRENIRKANHVVIVGGGPTGIELVGEILDLYKDKKITLIHSHGRILDTTFPDQARDQFANRMRGDGVDLLLNETVVLDTVKPGLTQQQISTKTGKTVDCDLVLLAFGNRPDTHWLKDTPLLSKNGYVNVNHETLQVNVKGWEHVFALGDVADLPEIKLAFRIRQHTPVLVTNLLRHARGLPPSKKYRKGADKMMVSYGRSGGIGQLPLLGTVGDFIASNGKSKKLLIPKTWKLLGIPMPTQAR
ncbi:hypothetical protein BCR43DRAFT_518964 [Syncephalastrum racemosum]|uniref:FAD/NAD(P)-binding domain-containing protein n=1 Tax=Syncephalastrum racemosum TaxID=13706 RepID=A0A1X2H1G6_SYNRA|nr:hypothetical protein BCR43DRAFT_518964 [Syncephalastrum racemosum]